MIGKHFQEQAVNYSSISAPEVVAKLVGDLAGAYSRRINIQHRLVYELFPEQRIVRILRLWTHYE